jgi:hypothetical protein
MGKIQFLIAVNEQNVRRAFRQRLVIRIWQSPRPRLTIDPLVRSECDTTRLFGRIRDLTDTTECEGKISR